MLKGHTTLVLTNKKNGAQKVIDSDNMITTAAGKTLQPLFGNLFNSYTASGSNLYYREPYNSCFGGLLVFDSAINTSKTTIDNSMNIIGVGSINDSTTGLSSRMGLYNAADSNWNSATKTFTYVYDFSTSNCNGVISSISLADYQVSRLFGKVDQSNHALYSYATMIEGATPIPYGYAKANPTNEAEKAMYVDFDNNWFYTLKIPTTTSVEIRKYEMPGNYTHIHPLMDTKAIKTRSTGTLISTDTIALTSPIYCSYMSSTYDIYGNEFVLVCGEANSSSVENGSNFLVTRIKFPELTVRQYLITNDSGVALSAAAYESNRIVCANATSSGNGTWCNRNGTNFEKVATSTKGGTLSYAGMGRFQVDSGGTSTSSVYTNGSFIYDSYLNSYVTSSSYNFMEGCYPAGTSSMAGAGYYGYSCFGKSNGIPVAIVMTYVATYSSSWSYYADNKAMSYIPIYLSTINNLDTPILKTTDDYLKIIYTLQEVTNA